MIHKMAGNEEVQGYGWAGGALQNHKKNLKFSKETTQSLRRKSIHV